LRAQGLSAAGTLEELARLLQHMAVEQTVPGALDETDPEADAARQLAGLLAADETQLLYSICLQGRAELSLAPDEYAGLVMVLLRFMAFPSERGAPRRAGEGRPDPARIEAPTAAGAAPAPITSAPLLARSTERAAMPVPTVAPVAAQTIPAPAAPADSQVAKPLHVAEDEPPPWMDEPPFEDEAQAAPVAVAVPLADAVQTASPVKPPQAPAPAAQAVATPGSRPVAASLVLAVQRTALGDRWAEVVEAMIASGSIVALARELAMQAELCDISAQSGVEVWRLTVERDSLRSATNADKLLAALKAVTGLTELRLDLVPGLAQDSPARRDAEQAALRQQEAEQTIQSDPLVLAMLSQFRTARIVPGSIKPV
jgi:DNA polymerase-3 subunit gamma/tau